MKNPFVDTLCTCCMLRCGSVYCGLFRCGSIFCCAENLKRIAAAACHRFGSCGSVPLLRLERLLMQTLFALKLLLLSLMRW